MKLILVGVGTRKSPGRKGDKLKEMTVRVIKSFE